MLHSHLTEEDGDTILTIGSPASEVAGIIIEDALASEVFGDLSAEDRRNVIQTVVALNGVAEPFATMVEVSGRTYRIEELPEDAVALDEFWQAKFIYDYAAGLPLTKQASLRDLAERVPA